MFVGMVLAVIFFATNATFLSSNYPVDSNLNANITDLDLLVWNAKNNIRDKECRNRVGFWSCRQTRLLFPELLDMLLLFEYWPV